MEKYDLGLAYVWEYDEDFMDLIEATLHKSRLTTFRITNHNIFEIIDKVQNRKLSFNYYFDRASDVDTNFENLGKMLTRRKSHIFNPYRNVQHAIDKASMHLEFMTLGLQVPYSIIVPPHSEFESIYISVEELAKLGRPFIIKPCNTTGGGIGVVTGAESLKEVLEERLMNTNDKYIIQQKIYPSMFDGRRGWFRCFWAFGKAIPVWWDDITHLYTELTFEEIKKYKLRKLHLLTSTIARLINLDFFSTEIVHDSNNRFVIIDYVNDQCDMRIKSKHYDGVPDSVVQQIIYNLSRKIHSLQRANTVNY